MRRTKTSCGAWFLVATISLAPAALASDAPPAVYAVIVANNRSLDTEVPPLRYADDDGVRYFELFSSYADRVSLFAVLDEETQRQHRGLGAVARPPRRRTIQAQVDAYFREMERQREEGRESVFYFIYSGHGDIGENREGYVNLLDARFTRTDLYRDVISASTATYNHVIIDSCNSYFMVNSRGKWRNDRVDAGNRDLLAAYVARESLDRYPNTGVVLSTSSAQETHEWSAYGAGVFSHQLRSGLIGTADVNVDGKIEYSEIRAYIAAANARVDDPKARISLYAKPPSRNLTEPLFDIHRMRPRAFLDLAPSDAGRLYLEDARGVRYADFNKAAEAPLRVALLQSPYYYLRTDTQEIEIRPATEQAIRLTPDAWKPRAKLARGSTSETFRRDLYRVPYGPSFYDGYVASHDEIVPVANVAALTKPMPQMALELPPLMESRTIDEADPPFYRRWWFWTIVGGAAAGVTGGAFYLGTQGGNPDTVPPAGSIGTVDVRP